ncbi:hypothetical protein Glove_101g47 [Diversispora epigaea]|uniref:Uncharacterized protein n=1 Tax=Diversispora epigaea TaxID=1348612 RepID=A0A397J4G7_9GLOM|nr:hypothetical protein Glove_101g47 [Diversispora epigaea]
MSPILSIMNTVQTFWKCFCDNYNMNIRGINKLLRRHLKRNYEEELIINENGIANHVDCINHCLLFAFGECNSQHFSQCLKLIIHHNKLTKYQEQLICYLSHQTRKSYLNTQFNAILQELNNYGTIIVVDYKMQIFEFFGKRKWTLYTTLVFQKDKKNNEKLKIQAYDHWSSDTKQDVWFTALYFEAIFEIIKSKPHWIKIILDNGGHYHNSELMAIISHWYNWYKIEVCGWIFLEPGETKTTVDSHHAIVIASFYNTSYRPFPVVSESTKPKAPWKIPIPKKLEFLVNKMSTNFINNEFNKIANENTSIWDLGFGISAKDTNYNLGFGIWDFGIWDFGIWILNLGDRYSVNQEFPLNFGWALKENMKFGNKGGEKRISKKIVQYLQRFFLAGNLRPTDRYSPEVMYACLKDLIAECEIIFNEISKPKAPWKIPIPKKLEFLVNKMSTNFINNEFNKIANENTSIWDLGFGISAKDTNYNLGFGIWDFGIWDFGIWILNLGDRYSVNQEFPLNFGWALKENMKFGNKGGEKRISKKIVQYLQRFFLAGNLRPTDRYSPEVMYACLKDLIAECEIIFNEISSVKTIKG